MDSRPEVTTEKPRATAAITRAASILEVLSSQHRALSLTELGREAGIPKSTLHGLLTDLVGTDLVRKVSEGGGYILGSRVIEFAHQYLDNDVLVVSFMDQAEPFVRETGETVHLGRLEGTDVVYMARRQGSKAVRLVSRVGTRFPASVSAIGKTMLTMMSDDEIRSLYAGIESLPTFTSRSIPTLEDLIRHVAQIRSGPGYAIDDEESQVGLRCYGAPLFRMSGHYFAISVTITASGHTRAEEDSIIASLLDLRTRLISSHDRSSQA